MLDDLFETTDGRIHDVCNSKDEYAKLLHGLILQGAYSLMDKEMAVKCRQQDVDSVNEVLEGVADDYEKALKSRPNFTVSDDYLPKSR